MWILAGGSAHTESTVLACVRTVHRLAGVLRNGGDFVRGHPDRATWLRERGFKMHTMDPTENDRRWRALLGESSASS